MTSSSVARKAAISVVGSFLDETDRIGDQRLLTIWQLHAACGRIQRGEKLVSGIDISLRQRIDQRRLSRVGITHQRHQGQAGTSPPLPMQAAMRAHMV